MLLKIFREIFEKFFFPQIFADKILSPQIFADKIKTTKIWLILTKKAQHSTAACWMQQWMAYPVKTMTRHAP